MKRGTIEHPKFLQLMDALKLPACFAAGVLETLWHWCQRYTPDGGIGKYSDEIIAKAIQWPGKADELIGALVATKWLDSVSNFHRLIVHDWSDHSPDSADKWLMLNQLKYADGKKPRRVATCRDKSRQVATSRDKPFVKSRQFSPVSVSVSVPVSVEDDTPKSRLRLIAEELQTCSPEFGLVPVERFMEELRTHPEPPYDWAAAVHDLKRDLEGCGLPHGQLPLPKLRNYLDHPLTKKREVGWVGKAGKDGGAVVEERRAFVPLEEQ